MSKDAKTCAFCGVTFLGDGFWLGAYPGEHFCSMDHALLYLADEEDFIYCTEEEEEG